jgi:hypothetical protein
MRRATCVSNLGCGCCLCVLCCALQVELSVTGIHVVSRAAGALPFELVDAARSEVRACWDVYGGGSELGMGMPVL